MKPRRRPNPAEEAFWEGYELVRSHPLFRPLAGELQVRRDDRLPEGVLAQTRNDGEVLVAERRREEPSTWAFVVAHQFCHVGFGHLATIGPGARADAYDRAGACLVVNRFLAGLRLAPAALSETLLLPEGDDETLVQRWRTAGGPPPDVGPCPGGARGCVDPEPYPVPSWRPVPDYGRLFAYGLTAAATAAVDVAGGARRSLTADREGAARKAWDRALAWFVSSYPLLGALAAGMRLVVDAELCRREDIRVAGVATRTGEIFVNPLAGLAEDEWRFVLAHEMLHAALRHSARAGHRDHYLFNVAADYQINGWLIEMGVGTAPAGVLHDASLAGLSAEAIYDRITVDLRRARKLMTLRGVRGLGDLCDATVGVRPATGVDLDEFYRRALASGLVQHRRLHRGLVPAGLAEEIDALDMPAIAWDAALARWFEEFVPAPEPVRSYARPSRRQASTPDIPRPGRVTPEDAVRRSTFGVVLDTSGSMDRQLLARALGSIAAFAAARDVPAARVVFCDAAAYDAGYVPTAEIAGRVRVRGRGGTTLQPGVDLLERAADFPTEGPILVITDGGCDVVRVRREHAFLVPAGATLPFSPRGPVFRMTV